MSDTQSHAVNAASPYKPSAKEWLEQNLKNIHQQQEMYKVKEEFTLRALELIEQNPEMDGVLMAVFLG